MTKGKTEMPLPKTIIGVIDLSSPEENQMQVAYSAARIANVTGLELKLYPKYGKKSITELCRMVDIKSAVDIICPCVHVCEQKKIFNIFPSINNITKKQHAAMIVIGDTLEFHKDMWRITEDSKIPVLLLPNGYEITDINKISIAIDMDRNVQKISTVIWLAKAFKSSVSIFMDKPKIEVEQLILNKIFLYLGKQLQKHDIAFDTEIVRKKTKFITRFCKYTAKHTDMAVMEIPEGSIKEEVEKNIEELMTLTAPKKKDEPAPKPVLLIRTRLIGRMAGFNG